VQPKDTREESALSRRAFVTKLAVGAAGAAVATAVTAGTAAALSKSSDAASSGQPGEAARASVGVEPSAASPRVERVAAPWQLLQPLALGAEASHGWRVAALSDIAEGSCVLTLENARGRAHRVHVCRNDGRPHGLVYTSHVDLIVMNGGQGDLPTEEGMGQAVAAVAHAIAANESAPSQAPVLAALMPYAQRVERVASAKLR
jgi:hypothetical protein